MEIRWWEEWEHVKCSCGGIIGNRGVYSNNVYTCDKCGSEVNLYKTDYDSLMINNKTGWIFPMKLIGGEDCG